MSLHTDKFFFNALKANADIMNEVEGRIFNPARSTTDEKEDRIPYIIVKMDGLTNDQSTKDDVEGDTDKVQIGIMVVADNRDMLAPLTEAVRQQCITYLHQVEEDPTSPLKNIAPFDWEFSAEGVQYDYEKPCVYQILNYQCSTNR